MITPHDETFLRRALRLAMNGRGYVEPNPMVACVLVKDGQIIGEGWHQKFGGPHAEPNALADCSARGLNASGATAYVTLEPCCHQNKKTPPCAPRLIEEKVARVVIGCLDPNPDVNGNGVAMLRAAGIEVDVLPPSRGTDLRHVEESNSRAGGPCHGALDGSHFQQLIAPFILGNRARRAYVTLKWAETADGFVAGADGKRLHISGASANRFVHELRAREGHLVVGVDTVIKDDPLLNARLPDKTDVGVVRWVLDSSFRVPPTARIITSTADQATRAVTHVVSSEAAIAANPLKKARLLEWWVNVVPAKTNARGQIDLLHLVSDPEDVSFFVEAGPRLAQSFFEDGLCDRLIVIRSPHSLAAAERALKSSPIPEGFVPTGTLHFDGDTLTEYLNTRSPAFFAAVPSADLVLAAESASSVA